MFASCCRLDHRAVSYGNSNRQSGEIRNAEQYKVDRHRSCFREHGLCGRRRPAATRSTATRRSLKQTARQISSEPRFRFPPLGARVGNRTECTAMGCCIGNMPAYCAVDGSIAPVDRGPSAKPILFRVALPASWNRRAAQLGGGGTNGTIPNLTGEALQQGLATYGSDSGHQNPPPGPRGASANPRLRIGGRTMRPSAISVICK